MKNYKKFRKINLIKQKNKMNKRYNQDNKMIKLFKKKNNLKNKNFLK